MKWNFGIFLRFKNLRTELATSLELQLQLWTLQLQLQARCKL